MTPETDYKTIPLREMLEFFRMLGADKSHIPIRVLWNKKLSDLKGKEREVMVMTAMKMIRKMMSVLMPIHHDNLLKEVLCNFGHGWKRKRMVVQGLQSSRRNSIESKFLRSLHCASITDKVMCEAMAEDVHAWKKSTCYTRKRRGQDRDGYRSGDDADVDNEGGEERETSVMYYARRKQGFYPNMVRKLHALSAQFVACGSFEMTKFGKKKTKDATIRDVVRFIIEPDNRQYMESVGKQLKLGNGGRVHFRS